jgi:hypothetical protein
VRHLPNVVDEQLLGDGRKLLTFEVNGRRREVMFGLARPDLRPQPGRLYQAPHREREVKANALLESLLDPEQLADWRATRTFWVASRRGPVQLGRLYSLLHHPEDAPDEERVLCVVPDDHRKLPAADVWANLLLVLRVCPDEFFDVANVMSVRPRR